MPTTKTITRYILVPEIDLPVNKEDKFKNSDKYWHEINLGYNTTVFDIVFDAVSKAGERVLSAISSK